MVILLKRFLGMLLIPAGLILLFFPLPDHRYSSIDKDFVFVIASPDLSALESDGDLRGITKEQLKPFPNILRVVETRGEELADFKTQEETDRDPLGLEELEKTFSEMEGASPEDRERYRETFAETRKIFKRAEEQSQNIQKMLVATEQESWHLNPTDIPLEEWQRMVGDLFGAGDGEPTFICDGFLYKGFVRYAHANIRQPIQGFDIGRRIAGGIFILIGIAMITGLYRKKTGIMISQRWGIVLWDVICISVSGFFIYGAIDFLLVKILDTPTATEEFLQLMGVFWVVFAIPLLAFIISATGSQSVIIDERGVSLDGLFSKRFIPWLDLRGIAITELQSVKRVGGFTASKQLMKIMRLTGETSSITLMEPPLKSTKRRIIEAMSANAPEKWKEIVEEQGKVWQAFF